jgi:hypothetical protein
MKEWYIGTIKNDATDNMGLHLSKNRGKKVYMYFDGTYAGEKVFRGKYPSNNISGSWNWWEDMFSNIEKVL